MDGPIIQTNCTRNDWNSSYIAHIDVYVLFILFISWIGFGIYFSRREGIIHEIMLPVNELHDMESKALGIVSSHQKRMVFGKLFVPPSRYLAFSAMWFEWISFTLLPLRSPISFLLGSNAKNGFFSFLYDGRFEYIGMQIFSIITLLIILCKLSRNRILNHINNILFYSIIYDVAFLPFISMFVNIATCTSGAAVYPLLNQNRNCLCPEYLWIYIVVGYIGFTTLYVTALHYKLKKSDKVDVQFRFQTSFLIVMALTRAFIPLLNVFFYELNIYGVSRHATDFIGGVLYFGIMYRLLYYNYINQPCLGSGRIANNIRSLGFASGSYASLLMLYAGIASILGMDEKNVGNFLETLCYGFPILWFIVWTINDKRAELYNIPVSPIVDLLKIHNSTHVRLVAATAIIIMPPKMLSFDQISEILEEFKMILNDENEDTSLKVKSCEGMWRLHVQLIAPRIPPPIQIKDPHTINSDEDNEEIKFIPFYVWQAHVEEERTIFHAVTQKMLRLSILVDKAEKILPAEETNNNLEKKNNKKQSKKHQSIVKLNEEDIIHLLKKNEEIYKAVLHILLNKKNDIQSRQFASKFIYNLYTSKLVEMKEIEFFEMTCLSCRSDKNPQMIGAIQTLHCIFVEKEYNYSLDFIANQDCLDSIGAVLLTHRRPIVCMALEVIITILKYLFNEQKEFCLLSISISLLNQVMTSMKNWETYYRIVFNCEEILLLHRHLLEEELPNESVKVLKKQPTRSKRNSLLGSFAEHRESIKRSIKSLTQDLNSNQHRRSRLSSLMSAITNRHRNSSLMKPGSKELVEIIKQKRKCRKMILDNCEIIAELGMKNKLVIEEINSKSLNQVVLFLQQDVLGRQYLETELNHEKFTYIEKLMEENSRHGNITDKINNLRHTINKKKKISPFGSKTES